MTKAIQQSATGAGSDRVAKGFGDAMTTAVEIAVIPVLFALFGRWLDTRFGTWPALFLVMTMLGVGGVGARAYYQYKADIAIEESAREWKH